MVVERAHAGAADPGASAGRAAAPEPRMLPPRFLGRVALVTGASPRGIGGAIAERLAREGAAVVVASLQRPVRLLERFGQLGVAGGWHACDVTDEGQVRAAIDAILDEHGRLDLVVNNAGCDVRGAFEDLGDEQWRRLIDVNLTGVMRVSRAAVPHLELRQGVIVNVTSAAGLGGTPGLAAYSAAKAGVDGLTRSLASEYAHRGVRVVGVAPALVKTPMSARHAAGATREDWDRLVACHPLGIGAPHDVAAAVAFLGSHEARWISGVTLPLGWMPSYPLPVGG